MSQPFIVGIGAAVLDHFYVVSAFPSSEGVQQATASENQGGGPVATALCVMARLGANCALLDIQGDDRSGQQIRAGLEAAGVNIGHIRVHAGATSPHASILVRQADGARHIVWFPSSAGELTADDVPEDLFAGAGLLHMNGRHEHACRRAIEFASRHNATISFDGGSGRYRESIRDLVLSSHIRILARDFAARMTGTDDLEAMAETLVDDQTRILIITDGINGSHAWPKGGEPFHQPAFPANPLIDTTGCGDVYHGAFLHGWMQGWSIARSAEFASRIAGQNAEGLGGRYVLQFLDPSSAN